LDLDALGRWLGHHLPGFTGLRGAVKFAGSSERKWHEQLHIYIA
jgi:hypothetical protein